jgi:hypothetical protein
MLSESLRHALGGGAVGPTGGFVPVRSLDTPVLESFLVLAAVRLISLQPLLGFADTGIDELPHRILRSLGHLLDADLVGAVTNMAPMPSPCLMPTALDSATESVVPVGVRIAFNRHRENEALFGRLDLRCRPVRASLHSLGDATPRLRSRP